MRAVLFSTTCLASLMTVAAPASAQTSAPVDPTASAATVVVDPAAKPATVERGEEIIVTGSRISRRDFKAESAI